MKLITKGGYTTPDDLEKPHEATLLKLDISKAVNLLKWRPSLTFHETVAFTLDGYKDELSDNNNLYQKRVAQIRLYTGRAISKNIEWAVSK